MTKMGEEGRVNSICRILSVGVLRILHERMQTNSIKCPETPTVFDQANAKRATTKNKYNITTTRSTTSPARGGAVEMPRYDTR